MQRPVQPCRLHGDPQAADDHNHGSAPSFLPHWAQERWPLLLVGPWVFLPGNRLGGYFLRAGASQVALLFYILAYLALRLMMSRRTSCSLPYSEAGSTPTCPTLAAARGAAILGEWAEGAFLLFLFGLGHVASTTGADRARNGYRRVGALM